MRGVASEVFSVNTEAFVGTDGRVSAAGTQVTMLDGKFVQVEAPTGLRKPTWCYWR